MSNIVLDTLFPNRCLECNSIIEAKDVVCSLCFSKINFTHFDYNTNHNFKQRCELLFPVENAFALMYFNQSSLTREIIHALKYRYREHIGENIANWCMEKLNFENDIPNLLVDVPLHPSKQKKRGYNQLHLFTETLSKEYKIPFSHKVFERNKNTKAQALKNKLGREKHQNLFSLSENIQDKHILLIDDVFTTGNTLSNLAWQLIAQNNKISILVMAWEK